MLFQGLNSLMNLKSLRFCFMGFSFSCVLFFLHLELAEWVWSARDLWGWARDGDLGFPRFDLLLLVSLGEMEVSRSGCGPSESSGSGWPRKSESVGFLWCLEVWFGGLGGSRGV